MAERETKTLSAFQIQSKGKKGAHFAQWSIVLSLAKD